MKTLATLSILFAALLAIVSPAHARRGNPVNAATNTAPLTQYYLIDSDDNDSRAPAYQFVDTLYDASHWYRVAPFTNRDDGYAQITPHILAVQVTDSFLFTYMDNQLRLPPRYVSSNGLIKLTFDSMTTTPGFNTPETSPNNGTMPTGNSNPLGPIVCPLWGDMEVDTTIPVAPATLGTVLTKVYWRVNSTKDTCYVSYYNLALKGTKLAVTATFQVVFATADSSVTFHYRSFDGSFNGTPAAQVFQDQATIGVQNGRSIYGTMYLDRGTYYAQSTGSQLYAKPLHTGLAVKFFRMVGNMIRIKAIDNPPYDGYELLSNTFAPSCTVNNFLSQNYRIQVKSVVTDLSTGYQIYSRTDSTPNQVAKGTDGYDTASAAQGFPCGKYRLTMTVSMPSAGTDVWTADNTLTRDFTLINTLSAPFYDNFDSSTTIPVIDPCNWHVRGATWVEGDEFFDIPPPNNTGAVLLDRNDVNGNPYLTPTGSDSMTSSPIDLHALSNVWLSFSYQRGLSTDSMTAGVKARVLIGPEPVDDSASGVYQGDSLIIEGMLASGTKLNDTTSADWALIDKLYGGLDYKTQRYRIQLPAKFLHDHFRLRIRLSAKDDHVKYGFPLDDGDNWLVDNIQISAPSSGQTDLEPLDVTLGAGNFTHVPRNVKLLTPVVTIGNNGLLTNFGAFTVHVLIKDALNRAVYDKNGTIVTPAAHMSSNVAMPVWDIQGSQGGTFTVQVNLAQNWNDYYKKNDTTIFYRTMYIDSMYALDDAMPDTSGTMTSADNSFYYDFTPLASDSLRGLSFYHLSASGNTNWTINIIDPTQNNKILRTIAFSYNVITPGFIQSSFLPFYMAAGTLYRMQFIMGQGSGLGGDGSYGLMWETNHTVNNLAYGALHSDVLSTFRTSGNVDYITANKNASAGGPILPMVRLKFAGSGQYLPVDLASFSAARTDAGSVNLAFRTAKEESVDHFTIDRESASGWVTTGNIPAKNEHLGAVYSLLDTKAPSTSLTYRLVEVDLDGTEKVIGTTAVGPIDALNLAEFGVQVNPNPTAQNIHVTISGSGESTLKLYDVLGKVVASKEHASISADFDASALPAGSYWLDAQNGDTHSRVKVSVVK
jgi:hypothetical protein